MTGEVENILKGSVVTTVEYDTGRRLIGVSTTNLIPGPNGIAPLAKQGAFQVPEKNETVETVDFVQAISNAQGADDVIAETVDLPMLDQQAALKEPVQSDVITENPVQVENPSTMSSFDLPKIEMPTNDAPVVDETPVAIDIQMPEMSDAVVADEPTGLNEQLFEGAAPAAQTSVFEEPAPVVAQAPIETVSPAVEPAPTVVEEAPAVEAAPVEEVVVETQTPVAAAPTIDIQLPVMENNQAPETQTGDIMESIPSTTPDTTIPTFNIEMPVINADSGVAPDSGETVAEPEPVAEVNPVEVPTPVEEVVEEIIPEVPVTESQPAVEPTPEVVVTEEQAPEAVDVVVQEEVSTTELPQEETGKQTTEETKQKTDDIKDIIHQHRVIIAGCADAISRIAEELNKAAKSLEELENKVANMTSTKEETAAKVEEIVQQGNSLVSDAFDRINAIAAPRI